MLTLHPENNAALQVMLFSFIERKRDGSARKVYEELAKRAADNPDLAEQLPAIEARLLNMEGDAAVEALDGNDMGGRKIKVNKARPRNSGF